MKDRIKYHIFLPLIFLAFFLETAFLPSLLWSSYLPHLVFIVLVASVFLSLSSDFLFTAFFFGFLFDVYSGADFGLFTLSVVFSAIVAYLLKEKFLQEESLIKVFGLSVAVIIFYDLLYLGLLFLVFGAGETFGLAFVWKKILFDSVSSVILVFPIMHLISNGKE